MHGGPIRIQHAGGLVSDGPSAADWDALVLACAPDNPFLEHAFLAALETSGCVGGLTGWQPSFLLAYAKESQEERLVGAVPLYRKDHSYGEFVFDWGWAGASERAGIPYYPKLVAAVPFTPVTGPRLMVRPGTDQALIRDALVEGLAEAAKKHAASSVHVLFCTDEERTLLGEHGFLPRHGYQYHWHNRTPKPYRDFDDYLSTFRSQKRKQVRRERQLAHEHGFTFVVRTGPELLPSDWDALFRFYRRTVAAYGSPPYLNRAFFRTIERNFADRVIATLALREGEPVAGTLNFVRGGAVFGRTWGAEVDVPMLHFELCYYRLIEFAIACGATRFEAGAQGEHKLARGLLPVRTNSAHLILHPALRAAVAEFLDGERRAVLDHINTALAHGPFARSA